MESRRGDYLRKLDALATVKEEGETVAVPAREQTEREQAANGGGSSNAASQLSASAFQ